MSCAQASEIVCTILTFLFGQSAGDVAIWIIAALLFVGVLRSVLGKFLSPSQMPFWLSYEGPRWSRSRNRDGAGGDGGGGIDLGGGCGGDGGGGGE